MAIKIKNKSKKKEELAKEENAENVENQQPLTEEEELEQAYEREIESQPDAFQSGVVESAAWASTHPATVFVTILAVVVLGASAVGLLKFLESRKLAASEELNGVFQANSYLIKDSIAYQSMKESNPNFEVKTFPSETARQEEIEKIAAKAVENRGGDSIAVAGYLAQGSALLKLGKGEEAEKIYEKIYKDTADSAVKTMAQFGSYQAFKAQGKNQEALDAIDALVKEAPQLAKTMRYDRARLLEALDKKAEAKELYHEILESKEGGTRTSDIERRVANL